MCVSLCPTTNFKLHLTHIIFIVYPHKKSGISAHCIDKRSENSQNLLICFTNYYDRWQATELFIPSAIFDFESPLFPLSCEEYKL